MEENDVSVRVAVRIRPQIPREIIDMCRICTQVTPNEPQVILGTDKAFTYDFVFNTDSAQESIYDSCVSSLINGALDGYNATVLAYGQTGSGKTYTMGTGFDVDIHEEQLGIIPRAISHLFQGIEERRLGARETGSVSPEFKITAQFLELYNEEVIDLFNPIKDSYSKGKGYKINEDPNGSIHIKGVMTKPVLSVSDALHFLKIGALSRTTASTQMNSQSSRSHAIFTLHIKQQRLVPIDMTDDCETSTEFETLTAKFHFVDLAGSERLKRTGATGERAKEGISINCGLLALGNVISALGDKSKKALHVPYRDSKLTRLLQDSLGGNSQTVMIACISPSDRDFMETLNTLKYANRARNIKNRITINQDKSSRTINILRQQIEQLQLELLEYKQGKRVIEEDGTERINDMFYENNMLQSELSNLKTRVKAMQETIDTLNMKNTTLLTEKKTGTWITDSSNFDVTVMIQEYLKEIEDLRAKLLESNYMCEQLRKVISKAQDNLTKSLMVSSDMSVSDLAAGDSFSVIEEARKEVEREIKKLEKSTKKLDYSDESTEESSETESDDEKIDFELQDELANLTTDIDMKQRLINELELSQQRLQTMRQHYEEKLLQLQTRIRDTQTERDKVLQSFTGHNSEPTDKIQRIRKDYERKLHDMQKELKRLQTAQKEHARLLRNQTQHETQLRSLKNEVTDMKKTKVKLLNKMKDESKRHKDAEMKRLREISQLKKESRRNANVIRTMEAEKRAKEVVLRRKQEEVSALKKERMGRFSTKTAGKLNSKYSMKSVKQKWLNVEKMINKQSLIKKGLIEQELRLEQLLEKRNHLGKDLEKFQMRKATLLATQQPTTEIDNLIEDIKANINYVQDVISETQNSVMEIEDSQETNETNDISHTVTDLNEARYLIQKLFGMTVNQGYTVAQREAKLKENEASLSELKQDIYVKSQLLDHMLHTDQDLFNSMVTSFSSNANDSDHEPCSNATSRSSSPYGFDYDAVHDHITSNPNSPRTKIRRRTALPQELLFGKVKSKECDDVSSKEQAAVRRDERLGIVRAHSNLEAPMHRAAERKLMLPSSPRNLRRLSSHQPTNHGSMYVCRRMCNTNAKR